MQVIFADGAIHHALLFRQQQAAVTGRQWPVYSLDYWQHSLKCNLINRMATARAFRKPMNTGHLAILQTQGGSKTTCCGFVSANVQQFGYRINGHEALRLSG